nr:MAG: RNA-dependent RNA polymerase [Army ant associated dicistrovirus 3]
MSVYRKLGQELTANRLTGSNAGVDECPSSGLKDGKTLPSTFMRSHDLFGQRTNYSFKKELPGLSKFANAPHNWSNNQIYRKNLDLGFINLKGSDLQHFFRDRGASRGPNEFVKVLVRDSYNVRKYGSNAKLILDDYYTSREKYQHNLVLKSKKPLTGHSKLDTSAHFKRCDLYLTSKIMEKQPKHKIRKMQNFYRNACHVMLKLPTEWYDMISMNWVENKKFMNIKRPQELKKSLIMSGELFSPARCFGTTPHKFALLNPEQVENKIFSACFQQITDQVSVPSQCCEDAYSGLLEDWKKIEHLEIEDLVGICDQIGFNVNINTGVQSETRSWIEGVTTRFAAGVTSIIDTTRNMVASAFTSIENIIKGLTAFIVGSILVGLAIKYSCLMVAKLFDFVLSLIFGYKSQGYHACRDQVDVGEGGFLGPLILLTSVFGVSSHVLKMKQLTEALRVISYLPRAESGVDTLLEWIKQTFDAVKRIYFRYVCGVEVPLNGVNHPVNEWLDSFQDLYNSWTRGSFVFDLATYSLVYSMWKTGNKLLRSPLFKQDVGVIKAAMSNLEKLLHEFRQKRIVSGTMRNPPVTILLFGGTGVGKSTCTMGLAASILNEIMPDVDVRKHWSNLVYARAAEQEYWDGYTSQPVCVFDDYSQAVDTAAAPNLEHFEIIRAANAFPYPLHMADLSDKGATNFESKIIICSSNLAVPKSESLNFPDALYRRFDLCVEVSVSDAHKGKEKPKHFVDTFYKFQLYSIDCQSRRINYGPIVSWDGLVEHAKHIYEQRSGFVKSVDRFIVEKCKQKRFEQNCVMDFDGEIWSNEKERQDELSRIRRDPSYPLVVNDQIQLHVPVGLKRLPMSLIDFRNPFYADCSFMQESTTQRWKRKLAYWWTGVPTVSDVFDNIGQILLDKTSQQYRNNVMEDLYKRCSVLTHLPTICKFVGVFVAAPLIFYGCKKIFSEKKEYTEVVIGESYGTVNGKPIKTESYNIQNSKLVKTESYGSPQQRTAKTESYGTSNTKSIKTESLNLDITGLPHYNNLVANEAAKQIKDRINQVCEQACIDQNAAEICTKVLTRNLYKMSVNEQAFGHCLFLKGRVGLMPAHYLYWMDQQIEIEDGLKVIFQSVFSKRSFTVDLKSFRDRCIRYQTPERPGLESRDLCHFTLLKDCPLTHPDISSLFCSVVDLQFLKNSYCCLPTLSCPLGSESFAKIKCTTTGQHVTVRDSIETHTTGMNNSRIIRNCWSYKLDSEVGDCGAPLILRNPQLQPGKIVGIHVAGQAQGFGYATPVYKKDIDQILSTYSSLDKVVDQICSARLPQGHFLDKPSFRYMDRLTCKIPIATKSVIEPSPIYGELQTPLTRPCQLRAKDGFDPIKYRLDLFGSEGIVVNQEMVDNSVEAIVHHLKNGILRQGNISEKAVYTFEEAIQGIDGEEYLSSIKRKSSPGFPYCTNGKFSTKAKFFGQGPDWGLEGINSKLLKSRCNEIVENAKQGIREIHPFIDTLKDERKPIAKAHKTRLFSACSLDYLICCKMYMMGLVSAVTKVRNFTGIAIGTNVYSNDWDRLAHLLLDKSENMVAGDFAGFDSTQIFQLLRAACDVIIKIFKEIFQNYTEEDVLVLQVLLESLCAAVHIHDGHVYQALKNLPSGHYLTAFINSIFVFILFCCAWQLSFGISLTSAFKFFEECGIIAYGDDHVVSIPYKYTFKFNQITLIDLFSQLNMKYTLEDKDAKVESPVRSLSEVTFLKRKFVFDYRVHRYIAPLSMDTILESPMWIKKCVDPVEQTVVELENSLRELSLYPQEIWDVYISKFKNCFKILGKTSAYLHRAIAFENVQKVWERSVFDQANCPVKNGRIVAPQMTSVCIYNYLPRSLEAAPQYLGKQDSFEKFKWTLELNNSLANNTQNAQSEQKLTSMADPISTLATEVNESAEIRQEITSFADDKAVVNQEVPMESNMPKRLRNEFHDDRNHSVISFLQRPRIVQTVLWQAQTANTQLVAFDVPTGIFSTMHRNKLDGFTSVRADAVIRVQVNAQPFQAGRLIAQVVPIPFLMGEDRVAECVRALDRKVVMHNVQLDISKQSEVTIRIPYVSPFFAFDLIAGQYEWARFVLSVYSPLNQVSQVALQVNVWAYFDNIELGYPTLSPLYTPTEQITDQIKLNTLQDISKAVEGKGFVTQAAGVLDQVVQSGADLVSGFVPSLGSVVKPVAKVTDAAFDVYMALRDQLSFIPGLSKPEPTFHGKTVLVRPTQNFGTGDGVDHGFKLAMHNMNRLDFIRNWAGSDMDELSFDYLKRMPNYISTFNYTNNSTFGTLLWSTNITPTYRSAPVQVVVGEDTQIANVTIPTPTHLQYICGPFQQWRGSLIYTFKFVKTDYHSGRVEICFIPFAGASDVSAQPTRFDYVYKIVVDLREQTEVSFAVDYTSVTPYKFINHSVDPITFSGQWNETRAWATGQLVVRAITPLQLGSNIVSSTIQCLVEVKAGDDFEVTIPVKQSFLPVRNLSTPADEITDQIFATAGSRDLRSEYVEHKIDIPSITGIVSNIPPITPEKALACVGESFGSFRTYIKRFAWFSAKNGRYYAAYNDFNPPNLNTGIVIIDGIRYPWLATRSSAVQDLGFDPLMYISNMYAFFRGGVRYKYWSSGTNDLVKASLVGTYPRVQNVPQVMSANAYELNDKIIYEFSMPFNSPTALAPVNYVEDAQVEDTVSSPTVMMITNATPEEEDNQTICVARAAADDFDLGYFIGPPLAFNLDAIPARTDGATVDNFGTSRDGRGLRLRYIGFDPVNDLIDELNSLNT